jgi:hypothetical protein
MDFIIKVVAELIARRIESGSRMGSLLGCLAGMVIGLILWVCASAAADLSSAFVIAFTAPLAILGAIIGSSYRGNSRPLSDEAANGILSQGIRITDFNHALIPPIFFVVFGTGAGLMCWMLISGAERSLRVGGLLLLMLVLTALLGLATLRTVLWVRIDDGIFLQKIFGGRYYVPAQIQSWKIISSEDAPNASNLIVIFDDKVTLNFPLSKAKTKIVAAKLVEMAPDQIASASIDL